VSALVGPIDTVLSPVSVRKPPRFRGISWKASLIACSSETGILQDFSWDARDPTFRLPCRRSRVRIPSAASQKACICRPFWSRQSPCSSVSGRTDSGLAPGRSSAVPQKTPVCRPFWSVRTQVLLRGMQKVGYSPAAAVTPTPAPTARPSGQRPPARYQRWRHFGPVRFQSETRRSTSARSAATPGEPWHREP
jgi:hypothetical protein